LDGPSGLACPSSASWPGSGSTWPPWRSSPCSPEDPVGAVDPILERLVEGLVVDLEDNSRTRVLLALPYDWLFGGI
jgi:hypothetical protein